MKLVKTSLPKKKEVADAATVCAPTNLGKRVFSELKYITSCYE
jgi:hypothetical protein